MSHLLYDLSPQDLEWCKKNLQFYWKNYNGITPINQLKEGHLLNCLGWLKRNTKLLLQCGNSLAEKVLLIIKTQPTFFPVHEECRRRGLLKEPSFTFDLPRNLIVYIYEKLNEPKPLQQSGASKAIEGVEQKLDAIIYTPDLLEDGD